jgi:holo-[acyl-carrier protein] synthase
MPKAAGKEPRIQIGIDIERVERFKKEPRSSSNFFSRIFTPRELEYCMSKSNPAIHLAGTFAAKEAAFKAVRSFYSGRISIIDFEISHTRDGAPRLRYAGPEDGMKTISINLSVSHTTESAVAVALALISS